MLALLNFSENAIQFGAKNVTLNSELLSNNYHNIMTEEIISNHEPPHPQKKSWLSPPPKRLTFVATIEQTSVISFRSFRDFTCCVFFFSVAKSPLSPGFASSCNFQSNFLFHLARFHIWFAGFFAGSWCRSESPDSGWFRERDPSNRPVRNTHTHTPAWPAERKGQSTGGLVGGKMWGQKSYLPAWVRMMPFWEIHCSAHTDCLINLGQRFCYVSAA